MHKKDHRITMLELTYSAATQVERLTDAALPLITGFRNNILQNPILVDAIDFASQTPVLQGFFSNVGNFSGDLAPVVRAYTVCKRLYIL